ncbi:hypothetical protein L198_07459 [Cryptococcus wingfieldii CBS 7118]|uniref:Uncharacterized protein n=1 Tax=Cryptococcus wingfieldii CBS 7118 TaxID=1295528 RepID=A0A1E3IDR2_9TREE|nr:hypothetical protein L198_07459 [Cryptococcus wingfieldii CBS 7118]ODN85891.1 hypothetical protein L198_07459 [Cryptococcus wingfieldii CBS 7118]
MYTSSLLALLPLLALAPRLDASPIRVVKREVPQEHSHEQFLTTVRASLNIDNPQNIKDPVFALLGNAAAAAGQGDVTNTDCLQQAVADQAFTNAKAAGDVAGQTAALIYRALERNTASVGLASVACNETATNPEIAAISQHQDPASDGAAATNKAITLELAKQIASVGGDPLDALKSGTFAAGDTTDNTGAGNTCDDADDADGCIFTQNLLQEDATEAEICSAVDGVSAATATVSGSSGSSAAATEISATAASSSSAAASTATSSTNAAAADIDIGDCTDFSMTFAGGLDNRAADEFTFEPTDQTHFNHGSALNPSIITTAMCDTFVNACAKSASTRDACKTVAADLDSQVTAGTLAKDQTFADAWLSGLESTFGVTSTGQGSAGSSANATTGAVSSTGTNAAAATDTLDVGACTDFSMTFAGGLDNRAADEFTFEPTDQTNFAHGSALNPSIITAFMCDTFVNACAQSAATRDACKTVAADLDSQLASGALAKDQGFADAWLTGLESALGVTSTGTGSGSGASSAAAATSAADDSASVSSSTSTTSLTAASTTSAADAAGVSSTSSASTASSTTAASGDNLQTFTGALNGVTATPVTNVGGDRPFQVKTDTFVNSAAALQRSCDQQFNGCANAANSGSGDSTVSDCSAQKDQCDAAATA